MRRVLGRMHHFEETDKDALFIWDTMQFAKVLTRIFSVITIFFGCVAVTTLCLGGIGVMNIMLVAVTERTREIGILKAMGATKADILKQFFSESVALTVLSGTIGYVLGRRHLPVAGHRAPARLRSQTHRLCHCHCGLAVDLVAHHRECGHVSRAARR